MAALFQKLIGTSAGVAAQAVPGGGIALKLIGGASQLLSKAIKKKTDKAKEKAEQAAARLAQFESLQGKGLVNRGVDTPTTPAQKAVFGSQPTEAEGYYQQAGPVAKFATLKKTQNTDMENKMNYPDMLKKYWWLAAAAVVLLFLGKKRR